MSLFTFHLIKTTFWTALKARWNPPNAKNVKGLVHAEYMTSMKLGSPVFSPSRMLMRQVAVFAQWENEADLNTFLTTNKFGKELSNGWYCRLEFLRKWGNISEFNVPEAPIEKLDPDAPVVAVTVARMKLLQVPRFIKWGKPVEKLVRDHPGTTLSLAAIRLPRTVSTFSIWNSQREMEQMVHGHSKVPKPKRHSKAMKERERKNFHYEFTTLRFRSISEHGAWKGRCNIIPTQKQPSK